MVGFTSVAVIALSIFGLTTAAPSERRSTGVVHRIRAGSTTANGGLHFEPENVVAAVGDYVEWHFLKANHSIVQSSFDKPCEPLGTDKSVFSGFNFATKEGESDFVFTHQVTNLEPFWYYCGQGTHCQKGMSAVINQNFNSNDKTLTAYKAKAVNTVTKQPSTDPLASQAGWKSPNTSKGE
jgi:plastocyanin